MSNNTKYELILEERLRDQLSSALRVRSAIKKSRVDLYWPSENISCEFFYDPGELEAILKDELIGRTDLADLPIRTRAKVAKSMVCDALGYDVPRSFPKMKGGPRLPHPAIDVYAQQSSNMQIWNQEVDAERRYVILILNEFEIVDVKVIAGADLAQYDRTGKLTSKFQASRIERYQGSALVSSTDTPPVDELLRPGPHAAPVVPVEQPKPGGFLEVSEVYQRLLPMVGETYADPGIVQERNRGTVVHREACKRLGAVGFADNGQFPDILSQLVEVKLQLSRTVDLGLELPSSDTPLASTNGLFSVRDVRYAIFYATRLQGRFTIENLVVTTGADFFNQYRQFGGLTSNTKLQLRLPAEWFYN